MRTIDADALKKFKVYSEERREYVVSVFNIDNAPTVTVDNYSMGYQDGVRKVLSERPKGEWIPVSERLPEKEGEYILWGKIDESEDEDYPFIGNYDEGCEEFGIWQEQFDRHTLGYVGSEFFAFSRVVAWQPLPEPYKEADNESK